MHSAEELANVVTGLGFNGVELHVRAGFRIKPQTAVRDLPEYVAQLRAGGVETISVAADLSEQVFAACHAAGVPLIRIMIPIVDNDFVASLRKARGELRDAQDLARRYGVGKAIQPHHGEYLSSCLGVRNLLEGLRGEYFGRGVGCGA